MTKSNAFIINCQGDCVIPNIIYKYIFNLILQAILIGLLAIICTCNAQNGTTAAPASNSTTAEIMTTASGKNDGSP